MGAFCHAATKSRLGQATSGGDDEERGWWSGARCQPANGLFYTIKYMDQPIDVRKLKQAEQTGCNTTEHELAMSAKSFEASDQRAQATAIDELKCSHIHHDTFVPTLHQVDELGLKLWCKVGIQPFGMELDDDNISLGLGCKWHRTSSQKRRGARRSLSLWWAISLPAVPYHSLSTTRYGNLRGTQ